MPPLEPKQEPDANAAETTNVVSEAQPDSIPLLIRQTASHDQFFKLILGDVNRARLFLQWVFQLEKIEAPVDLSRLEIQSGTLFGGTEKKSPEDRLFADLLFKAPLRVSLPDKKRKDIPVYIFFLLEHKSSNDNLTAFQLLRYQVAIWKMALNDPQRKPSDPFPFILPIIVHHGRGPFTSPTNIGDLIIPVEGLEKYRPSVPCMVVDVETIEEANFPRDEELYRFFNALKDVFAPDVLERMEAMCQSVRDKELDDSLKKFYVKIFYYIGRNALKTDVKRLEEMMRTLSIAEEDIKLLSAWQQDILAAEARGEALGKAQGEALGEARGKALGKALGEVQGALQQQRKNLLKSLASRLGNLPGDIVSRIESNEDLADLERLFGEVFEVVSWDDFRKVMSEECR